MTWHFVADVFETTIDFNHSESLPCSRGNQWVVTGFAHRPEPAEWDVATPGLEMIVSAAPPLRSSLGPSVFNRGAHGHIPNKSDISQRVLTSKT
jgi:hypothetical protein